MVRHLTKNWQEHDGLCQCGLAKKPSVTRSGTAPATCSSGLATADAAKELVAVCRLAIGCWGPRPSCLSW